MDAFESIIALYFEEEGFWVKHGVKVAITKAHKKTIGLPSMPRPEIDLLAYNPGKNELLLIEVKSYIDSNGVLYKDVNGSGKGSKRYKLFTNNYFRKIVTQKLLKDFKKSGLLTKNVKVIYALAAGKIKKGDADKIKNYFNRFGWILFTPEQICSMLKKLVDKGWEDNAIVLAAKLILRQ